MDTRAYFEQHPERFWISLAGATVLFLLSVRRAARTQGAAAKILATLATVVAGVQVVKLIRMRPGSSPAAIDWSR